MLIKAPAQGAHISSTSGHTLILGPGEKKEVNGEMLHLALRQGCAVVEKRHSRAPDVPVDSSVSDEEIADGIRRMIEDNVPDGWDAQGRPKGRSIKAYLPKYVSIERVHKVFYDMDIEPQVQVETDEPG